MHLSLITLKRFHLALLYRVYYVLCMPKGPWKLVENSCEIVERLFVTRDAGRARCEGVSVKGGRKIQRVAPSGEKFCATVQLAGLPEGGDGFRRDGAGDDETCHLAASVRTQLLIKE